MHLDWPRSGNNLANLKLDDCSTMKTWKKIVKDHDHVVCRSRTKGTFLISSGVVDRTLQIIMKIRVTCTADFLRPLHKSSFAKATCYKRVLLLRVFFEHIWGEKAFFEMNYLNGRSPTKAVQVTRVLPPSWSFDGKLNGSILGGTDKNDMNEFFEQKWKLVFEILTTNKNSYILLCYPIALAYRTRIIPAINFRHLFDKQSAILENSLSLIDGQKFT